MKIFYLILQHLTEITNYVKPNQTKHVLKVFNTTISQ